MAPADPHEARIRRSWRRNATAWTEAVRAGHIESRRLVTDEAVVAAVREWAPASVIDLGCGEGWLCRVLAAAGARVLGVDAEPALIECARHASAGGAHIDYRVLDYAAVAAAELDARAALVSCNFALLGEASSAALLGAVPSLLEPGGVFVMQTLHPWAACGEAAYADGWREGSWAGCGEGFAAPAPWYFRTLGTWMDLLRDSGLRCLSLREPVHPRTGRPVSLLLVCAATS